MQERARLFSLVAHSATGQVRKYNNIPYWVHPYEVAKIVSTVNHTEAMIAAAYLHDVVEDTHITIDLIRDEFSDEVANMVEWLTDISKKEDGNRAIRKAIDREHIKNADSNSKTIKLADIISNTIDIHENDPEFFKVYSIEMKLLLEVLIDGDSTLFKYAQKLLK
jgi:(p)ppGpp synthase/HD superfamily hydrolase